MTKANFEADRERWAAIVASERRGERISAADADLKARFEGSNPEVIADEAWLWAGLGSLGDARVGSDELSDAALLERVLAQAGSRAGAAPGAIEPPAAEKGGRPARVIAFGRPRTRRGIAAAFGAFALAAALAALAAEMLRSNEPSSVSPKDTPSSEPAQGAAPVRGRGKGVEAAPTEAAPEPNVEAAPTVAAESNGATNDLKAPAELGNPAVVSAPGLADARSEKAASADVKAHEAPRETADTLLKSAQAKLGEGNTGAAVEAYKELLSRYPSSAEARAALISLGRLSLGGGGAAEALAYFDRYLAGAGGPLSVEARYGRIQALRRLGRGADEAAAIQEFLAHHGESVYAPRLRERLASLSPSSPAAPTPAAPPASPR